MGGNSADVVAFVPTFPQRKHLAPLTTQAVVITSAVTPLHSLRHADAGERELPHVERYHDRVLAYDPPGRATAL